MSFAVLNDLRRRTIRAPINPMDKCTIVSIYPQEIGPEKKPTISPGIFLIPAGTYDVPGILVVGPSSWWRDIDENQPLLEIPNSSIQVADSVVKDYCNGLLACNMSDAMPGLYYLNGAVSIIDIKGKYKQQLDDAKVKQKKWYEALINMGDALWARSNGNPLSIHKDMRLAAKELGYEKEWMKNTQSFEMVRCVACGALRNPQFPICQACKAIVDKDKAKELGLTFAS